MSEYEVESGELESGLDVDVGDGGQEWSPSRDEWEQMQSQLADASELRAAVEWQAQQDQAAQQEAAYEQWIGDPVEDPSGYAARVAERARLEAASTAEAAAAPFQEAYTVAVNEAAMERADEEALELLSSAAAEHGFEFSPKDVAVAYREIDEELEKVKLEWASQMLTESHLRYGLPVDEQAMLAAYHEAEARLLDERTSRDTGLKAIEWWAGRKANEQRKRGDEFNLVKSYFSGSPAQRPADYDSAAQQQVAARALGRIR